jgi:cytosine/uracil/thiamine/allantoin permease
MFVSPQKIRYLFLAKAIIAPPTWLALLIWAFVKVPPNISLLTPKNTLSGDELRWARLSAFNSAFGFFATTGFSMSNFTVSNHILYNRLIHVTTISEIREKRKGVRAIELRSDTNETHIIS